MSFRVSQRNQHGQRYDGIFLGILKTEMFYSFEKIFKSLVQLEQAITDNIFYYNNKRINAKTKGLSPIQYRTKSFQ